MADSEAKEPVERELKFAGVDLEKLRERLLELEAERLAPSSLEENWVFDRQGELLAAGCVLRLREDGRGALVTFKGPARFEGTLKVRREHEMRVDSAEQARALFESLGYRVVRRYQKYREEWRLGSEAIALDHTPIGDFVEFEGANALVIARRCGFDPATADLRTYLRLYEDHLERHPEAPRDMLFP